MSKNQGSFAFEGSLEVVLPNLVPHHQCFAGTGGGGVSPWTLSGTGCFVTPAAPAPGMALRGPCLLWSSQLSEVAATISPISQIRKPEQRSNLPRDPELNSTEAGVQTQGCFSPNPKLFSMQVSRCLSGQSIPTRNSLK